MSQKSVQSSKPSQDPAITKWEAENRAELQETLRRYVTGYQEKEAVYVQANAKSAESILALCKVVADAWGEFVQLDDYLNEFRRKTNLTNKSTFSQHRTVGLDYERLIGHVEQLPSSWYTLYQIARLNDDTFEKAIAAKAIHPRMTQREVHALAGRSESQTTAIDVTARRHTSQSILGGRRLFQIEFRADAPLVAAEVEAFRTALWDFLRSQPAPFSSAVSLVWSKALKDALYPPARKLRGRRLMRPKALPEATSTQPPNEGVPEDLEAFFEAETRTLAA